MDRTMQAGISYFAPVNQKNPKNKNLQWYIFARPEFAGPIH